MARKKKNREWMVIITLQDGDAQSPVVLTEDDAGSVSTFSSMDSISELKCLHILGENKWAALNFVTGEYVEF